MRRLVAGVLALMTSACWHMEGSGVYAEQTRPVGAFSEVVLSGGLKAEISAGAESSVVVSGDDNLVCLIGTTVDRDKLVISPEPGILYSESQPLVVRVTAATLSSLEASGASHISARGISTRSLSVEASGASLVDLTGWAERVELEVSGASTVRAFDLASNTAVVEASGASKVQVRADLDADVEASGASEVEVAGEARIREDVSGASKVTRVD